MYQGKGLNNTKAFCSDFICSRCGFFSSKFVGFFLVGFFLVVFFSGGFFSSKQLVMYQGKGLNRTKVLCSDFICARGGCFSWVFFLVFFSDGFFSGGFFSSKQLVMYQGKGLNVSGSDLICARGGFFSWVFFSGGFFSDDFFSGVFFFFKATGHVSRQRPERYENLAP